MDVRDITATGIMVAGTVVPDTGVVTMGVPGAGATIAATIADAIITGVIAAAAGDRTLAGASGPGRRSLPGWSGI